MISDWQLESYINEAEKTESVWGSIVSTLIEEIKAIKERNNELKAETLKIYELYENARKIINRDTGASYCAHCLQMFPKGDTEEFGLHIQNCSEHPLTRMARDKEAAVGLALKIARERNHLRGEFDDYRRRYPEVIESEQEIETQTNRNIEQID